MPEEKIVAGMDLSPYEQAVRLGKDKDLGLNKCEYCKGTGKTGPTVCLNCEGMGGTL